MVDERNQMIEIWNGGGPEAMFINNEREILRRFPSNAAPLGIMPEEDFSPHTQMYQWSSAGELLAYSDGAVDALNVEGEAFGEERLEQSLHRLAMIPVYVRHYLRH